MELISQNQCEERGRSWQKKVLVIGISGPTSAGKSVLAGLLGQIFGGDRKEGVAGMYFP